MNSKKFKTNFFKLINLTVTWLTWSYSDHIPEAITFRPLLLSLDGILYSRGVLFTISFVKKLRSGYLNYLSGNINKIEGIGLTTDGIPKILGDLIPLIRQADPRVPKGKGVKPYS
jgi:hypothetical protein